MSGKPGNTSTHTVHKYTNIFEHNYPVMSQNPLLRISPASTQTMLNCSCYILHYTLQVFLLLHSDRLRFTTAHFNSELPAS